MRGNCRDAVVSNDNGFDYFDIDSLLDVVYYGFLNYSL
jgi:hypothetical protein